MRTDAQRHEDRRAFLKRALAGSAAVAAALAFPGLARAAAPAAGVPAAPVPAGFVQPESTRRMAARLAQITREADPLKNPYRNADQVERLRTAVAGAADPHAELLARMKLAWQLLDAGDASGALKHYELIQQALADLGVPPAQRSEEEWLTFKAVAYLRLGENENCLDRHNPSSCLFPIAPDGVHRLQRGSRGAIGVLAELLGKYPGDLRARWLINIAYMTLGEYPDQVPPAWLIGPQCFAAEAALPRFPDVAPAVGLDLNSRAGGVVLEDLDGDGLLDLMVSSWGVDDPLRVFKNNGDGTFTERTEAAGLRGLTGGLNLIHCDYNNDGHIDVLVLRGAWLGAEGRYPCSLLRNNGDFTFTDVTEEAGLLRFKPTQAAVWFDYNGDGWLDLFIANESQGGDRNPCELFRNNGDGTFTECAALHGVDLVGFFKGVVSADYNLDGRPDLYLSRLDGAKVLLRNDGPAGGGADPQARWRFTDVADQAGVTDPPSTFGCWFFDYDNDGWPDLFVSGYAVADVGDFAAEALGLPCAGQRARLYRNNRDGTFSDVTRPMGLDRVLLSMGHNFGDLDNDGWLDFYVGTGNPDLSVLVPNRMFKNDRGQRFLDVTTAGGFGQLQKGHGIAFGDVNNSGTQDIYSVVGGAVEADHYRHQLFANPGFGHHWLKLRLEGVRSNRAAVGARIRVLAGGPDGDREIHRTVGTGGSFGSSTYRQEIGLGTSTRVTRVEIRWPASGLTQVLEHLDIDTCYHVREGEARAVAVTLPTFRWPAGAGA